MAFLRRLFGRLDDVGEGADAGEGPANPPSGAASPPAPARTPEEDERAHELELARFEQDRTTDLVRRQQMYTDRSWVPPAQGGTARAGEEETDSG